MTLMPEVHDALTAAVAQRRGRRWWRSRSRLGLLAAGGAVVTGTALAATGSLPWHPTLGHEDGNRPAIAATPLPTGQSGALAVLRRPQTAADREPRVREVLRLFARDEINGIHTSEIRVLRTRPDGITMLVPAERIGRHDPGHPSSLRRRVLCVISSTHAGPGGGVSAGVTCGDLRDLRTKGIGAISPAPNGFRSFALVPDGVARVILRMRNHRYLSGDVRDNLYEIDTGDELAPGWGVTWLDADGRRIEHRGARSTGP